MKGRQFPGGGVQAHGLDDGQPHLRGELLVAPTVFRRFPLGPDKSILLFLLDLVLLGEMLQIGGVPGIEIRHGNGATALPGQKGALQEGKNAADALAGQGFEKG